MANNKDHNLLLRYFYKVAVLLLLPIIFSFLFTQKAEAAQYGNMYVDMYISLDGLVSTSTRLPGAVVWAGSPLHKDLFNKPEYDPRGGSPQLFMVTSATRAVDMVNMQGNVRCGSVSTDPRACNGLQVFGPSFQAIRFGGMPRSQMSVYNVSTHDSSECPQTFRHLAPSLGEAGRWYETGWLGGLQCVAAVYSTEQDRLGCPGVRGNASSREHLRLTPYFPRGWYNAYGTNFPINFEANDPKGGGYFMVVNVPADVQDNGWWSRFVRDQVVQNFNTINFPNPTTPYYGTTDHPYVISTRGQIVRRDSGEPISRTASESVYMSSIGNTAIKSIVFHYIPSDNAPIECGSPCTSDVECRNADVGGYTCIDFNNDGTRRCALMQCADPSLAPLCSDDGCAIATPTPTPTVTDTPTPTPSITDTPTPTPSITDTPTPTPTPSFTPSPTPSPSISTSPVGPVIIECYETGCDDPGFVCVSGLVCQNNRCVHPQYPNSPDCKPSDTLPPTALISDSVDRIILAYLLIMLAIGGYASGFFGNVGKDTWDRIGQPLLFALSPSLKKKHFEKSSQEKVGKDI
ncbi:MAG: hypothetical protein QY330_04075 [Candidatus Dojkabacteria bacterium]|nr:MAG: hypothetical protein QY330_04075 [Candidatus Dojkabacteria bacterium]